MAGKVMKLGLAGLGADAVQLLDTVRLRDQLRVVAAFDDRPEALATFGREFDARTFDDFDALCDDPGIDVVYISTPATLRARHAVRAARSGKQVIVDKPMALTLTECDAMIEAADAHGVRLQVGHSVSMAPALAAMADLVASGSLGPVLMVNTWHSSEWMFRPRRAAELDNARGGGVVFRQAPHQVDIVRMLGGGLATSVRGSVSHSDRRRGAHDTYSAFVGFASGAGATMVFNGNAHFPASELTYGIGSRGQRKDPQTHLKAHRQIRGFADAGAEEAYKRQTAYGGKRAASWGTPLGANHQFFGLTVVSCVYADVRQTPDGLMVYGEDGWREIPVPKAQSSRYEVDIMYDAWVHDDPLPSHDGRWGRATMEVCLGLIESSRLRSEVALTHQVPYAAQPSRSGSHGSPASTPPGSRIVR